MFIYACKINGILNLWDINIISNLSQTTKYKSIIFVYIHVLIYSYLLMYTYTFMYKYKYIYIQVHMTHLNLWSIAN